MPKDGSRSREGSVGRRAGRHTTHETPAYDGGEESKANVLMEPDATGARVEIDEVDGYHQPTAMFDKGELLGELAELEASENAPPTRHEVETQAPPKGCRLICVAGPDLGVEWSFKQDELTIGRAAENQIEFADIAVSRNHARIAREGTIFTLADLGSDNGTFLNGEKIEEKKTLSSGDEIVIGSRTLRFVELNEAPATDAAHPLLEVPPDPEIGGSPSQLAAALMGAMNVGQSEVDLGALGSQELAAEPAVSSSKIASAEPHPEADAVAGAPKGTALKMIGLGLGGLAMLAGLIFLGLQLYRRVSGETEATRAERARREFLQGVELVKARRFGDAIALFDGVLAVRPEYVRAKEYRAYAGDEIATFKALEEARKLVAEKRCDEALDRLEKLPSESAWAPEIQASSKACQGKLAEARVEEARSLFEAGERDLALEVVQEALQQAPGLIGAIALRDKITGADRPRPEPKAAAPKPKTPPELEGAVALYLEGQLAPAIDAAEAAGGPEAARYIARMKKMQGLLDDLSAAHTAKAAADLIRLGPDAQQLDQSIGLGQGAIAEKIREYYADGLYLKSLESMQDEDFATAYQMLAQALKIRPGHNLSEARLIELSAKAKELYYQGHVLKDSKPDETRTLFKRVVEMTKPDNQFHLWAAKWLSANGG